MTGARSDESLTRPPYNAIIVGGGPAGLGGAHPRMLSSPGAALRLGPPPQRSLPALHGFLTRDGVRPGELVAIGRRQLARYRVELVRGEIIDARRTTPGFEVVLANGRRASARASDRDRRRGSPSAGRGCTRALWPEDLSLSVLRRLGGIVRSPSTGAGARGWGSRSRCGRGAFTRKGAVKTNRLEVTGVRGLSVAGDASRDVQLAIVAAAEGAKATFRIGVVLPRLHWRSLQESPRP